MNGGADSTPRASGCPPATSTPATSTSATSMPATSMPATSMPATSMPATLPPGTMIGGRYQLIEPLGAGAQGCTYAVRDVLRGGRLALKLMPLAAGAAPESLQCEYRALCVLDHPAVVGVHDCGVSRSPGSGTVSGWFYTADLIRGRDLMTATDGASPERVAGLALQALAALGAIHARGVLHRDLKPDNLLVGERDRLRIIDFGLALGAVRAASPATAAGPRPDDVPPAAAGTPDYLAPEVARGVAPDARAELYALGAVLYQALTRRLPFPAANAAAVIQRHLQDAPRPLRELRPELPAGLERFVLRLLEKDPGARFAHADQAYAALAALFEPRALPGDLAAAVRAAACPSRRLRSGELFGRSAERAQLRALLGDDGAVRAVLVEGVPGTGKTALIREFLREAALAELPVLSASGGAAAGGGVLQAVAEVVTQAAWLAPPAVREAHAELLGAFSDAARDAAAATLPADGERLRLAAAVCSLLAAVAGERPLLVSFEALEQADAATLEVVAYLLRNGGEHLRCVIELGDGGQRANLAGLLETAADEPSVREVRLAPFTPEDTRALVEFLLIGGAAPRELCDRIAENTGEPRLVVELLRFLLRQGHLVRQSDGAYACPHGVPVELLRRGVGELVAARFADVTGEPRRLLWVLALAREPLAAPVVEGIVGREPQGAAAGVTAAAVLEDLWSEGLIVARAAIEGAVAGAEAGAPANEGGRCYALGSDLERQVLAESVPADESRRLHGALFAAYEARGAGAVGPELLAHHASEAGLGRATYRHALRAARKADRLGSDDGARRWYEMALAGAENETERGAVLAPLAAVCRRCGRLGEGLAHLDAALAAAGSRPARQRGRLLDQRGELYLDKGDLERAGASYEQALAVLEQAADAGTADRAACRTHLAWLRLHRGEPEAALTTCSELLAELAAVPPAGEEPGAPGMARRLVLMCQGATQLGTQRFVAAATTYEQALALARQLGDAHAEATALSNLGVARSLAGAIDEALLHWRASLAIRQRLQHFKGIAECQNNIGIGHYEHGRPAAALESYRESLAIYRRIGARLGQAMAWLNIGESCLDLGWLQSACEATRRALAGFVAAGEEDGTQRSFLQMGVVFARLGWRQRLEALVAAAAEHAPGEGPLPLAVTHRLRGLLARASGDPVAARAALEAASAPLVEIGESRLAADNLLDLVALEAAVGVPEAEPRSALERLRSEQALARSPLLALRAEALELGVEGLELRAGDAAAAAEVAAEPAPVAERRAERLLGLARRADELGACQLVVQLERRRGQLLLARQPAPATGTLQRALDGCEALLAADRGLLQEYGPRAAWLPAGSRLAVALDFDRDALREAMDERLDCAGIRRELEAARRALAACRGAGGPPPAFDRAALSAAQERLLVRCFALAGGESPEEVGNAVLAAIIEATGARRARLALRGGERALDFAAEVERPVAGAPLPAPRPRAATEAERRALERLLARRQEPLFLVGGAGQPEAADAQALLDEGWAALLVVPWRFEGGSGVESTDGALIAVWETASWLPNRTDEALLSLVGAATGGALAGVLRRQEDRRRLEQITRLYELSSVPVRSLDPEQVLSLSMASMIALTGAERGFLFMVHDGEFDCRVARDQRGRPLAEPAVEVSWSILTRVFESRQAVKVDDALSDRQLSSQSSIVDLQLRSVLCIPIRSEDGILGLAYVDNRSRSGKFTDHDLEVFNMFGVQIATALDKAYHHAQLQETNRLKSEFLANVSHELRTPLNGIIGFTQLLAAEPLSSDGSEYLRYVDQSAQRLLKMVDELLTLSSFDAGTFELADEPFDLHDFCREVQLEFAGRCGAKGLDAEVMVDGAVPRRVRGDRLVLRQVLDGLLENALRFTEQGAVRVRVGLPAGTGRRAPGDDHDVRFEVEDTGSGIPEAMQERIFQAFTQADGSLTRRHDGAGLGLAVCERLVRSMGGQIGVESRPGAGSRFWFAVRLRQADAAPLPAGGAGAAP